MVTLMVTNANFVECTLGSCSGITGVGFSQHHFNGYLVVHCQGLVINDTSKFLKNIFLVFSNLACISIATGFRPKEAKGAKPRFLYLLFLIACMLGGANRITVVIT